MRLLQGRSFLSVSLASIAVAVAAVAIANSPTSPTRLSGQVGFSPGHFVLDISPDELRTDLDLMVSSGVGWIRLDVDWSRIELDPGEYSWEQTDRLIRQARARGLDVLGLLANTPTWARPSGTPDKTPPNDLADFGRFVADAVARYEPLGVFAWEIWNEPNVADFWSPVPDPVAYAELLTVAAHAIRSVDPDALVITGGLAPARDGESELSPSTFLATLYDEVPADTFDAVGVHPYSYPALPDAPHAWNLFARLPELHRLMSARGDREKQLWLTEYGAPTGQGSRAVSEADQADMIRGAVAQAQAWEWTGPLFIYSHRDRSDAVDYIEENFGLLRVNGDPKPSWAALVEQLESISAQNDQPRGR